MPSRNQFRPGRKQRSKEFNKVAVEDGESAFFTLNPFIPSYMPQYQWISHEQYPGLTSLPLHRTPGSPYYLLLKNEYFSSHPVENGRTGFPVRQLQNNIPYRLLSANHSPVERSMGPCGPPFTSTDRPSSSQDSPCSQMASGGLSDIEKLRWLKETILSGQHPFFTADPKPDALAKLYLGPHPVSKAYNGWTGLEQQQISKGLAEDNSAAESSHKSSSTDVKLVSEIPSAPSLNSVNVSEPLSAAGHEATQNGSSEGNVQVEPLGTIASGSGISALVGSQKNDLSPIPSAPSIQGESMNVDRPQNTFQDLKPPHKFGDSHQPSSSHGYENARDSERNRERSGYPLTEHPHRSDSYRYPQYSDRRDYGRYNFRHSEGRYDRDHRDWDRDRDRGRPTDRPIYEKPLRSSAPVRRASVSASVSSFSSNVETKNPGIVDGRNLRSEVPPHPEQRPIPNGVIPHFDQRSLIDAPSGAELRHSELHPPSGPRQPSLAPQHPEQRQGSLTHPEQHPGELPYTEPKRPLYTTMQHNGRRAPLPYTDLHPPHSDLGSLDTEVTRPPSRQLQQSEPVRPIPDQRPASRIHEAEFQKSFTNEPIPPRPYTETVPRDSYADQSSSSAVQTTTERAGKRFGSGAPLLERRSALPVSEAKPTNLESPSTTLGGTQRPGPTAAYQLPSERHVTQSPGAVSDPRGSRLVEARQGVAILGSNFENMSESPAGDRGSEKFYFKPSSSPHRRPVDSTAVATRDQRPTTAPSFREGPAIQPRSHLDNRRPFDAGPPRRPPPHHYPPPPHAIPSSQLSTERREVDRREESRQWRERSEHYPPFDGQVESERGGRRFIDTHGLPRGRPPPMPPSGPASWDRDKNKEYEPLMKYPPRGSPPPLGSGSVQPRWEEPPPAHAPPPPSHRPLQARLGDTYDQRFIPRDAVDRSRYRPLSPPPADMAVRDTYRDNPRLRPRSPSPMHRPAPSGGTFDDGHRPTKRVREEYDMPPPRPGPYYDEGRRGGEGDPYVGGRSIPPHPPYYDHRAGGVNPRDPPYPRDRVAEQYVRRDAPRSRSPPFYPPRERYPPR